VAFDYDTQSQETHAMVRKFFHDHAAENREPDMAALEHWLTSPSTQPSIIMLGGHFPFSRSESICALTTACRSRLCVVGKRLLFIGPLSVTNECTGVLFPVAGSPKDIVQGVAIQQTDKVTNAPRHRYAALIPETRLVTFLREPLARIVSLYAHKVREGRFQGTLLEFGASHSCLILCANGASEESSLLHPAFSWSSRNKQP